MLCVKCGTAIEPSQKFCPECGTPVAKVEEIKAPCCADCGAPLKENQKFCTACGKPVPAEEPVVEEVVEALPPHCAACGTELTENQKFCPECGMPVQEAEPVVEELPLRCAACGYELDEGQKFCPECGKAVVEIVEKQPSRCASCGAELNENQKFCAECGASATAEAPTAAVSVKKATPPAYVTPAPVAERPTPVYTPPISATMPAESAPARHCPRCGEMMKSSQKYCLVCGASVDSSTPTPATEPVYATSGAVNYSSFSDEGKRKTILNIGVPVIIGLVLQFAFRFLDFASIGSGFMSLGGTCTFDELMGDTIFFILLTLGAVVLCVLPLLINQEFKRRYLIASFATAFWNLFCFLLGVFTINDRVQTYGIVDWSLEIGGWLSLLVTLALLVILFWRCKQIKDGEYL